jgi:hypothetical protein
MRRERRKGGRWIGKRRRGSDEEREAGSRKG